MKTEPKWETFRKGTGAQGGRAKKSTLRVTKDQKQISISPKAKTDAGLEPGDTFDLLVDTHQRGFRPLVGIRKHPKGQWKVPKGNTFSCADFLRHYKLQPGTYDAKVVDGVLQATMLVRQ